MSAIHMLRHVNWRQFLRAQVGNLAHLVKILISGTVLDEELRTRSHNPWLGEGEFEPLPRRSL